MRFVTGWHTRGYLPHFDDGISLQCVTYRLFDALPAEVVERLQERAGNDLERSLQIECLLNAGHGCCALRAAGNAAIVIANWRHFDGLDYRLHAWVVMPNHVHVLIEPKGSRPLSRIIHSWKSYTAKQIAATTGMRRLWQPDYWDRFIRNRRHYLATVEYIHQNPVRAGLCTRAEGWPWSSAHPDA